MFESDPHKLTGELKLFQLQILFVYNGQKVYTLKKNNTPETYLVNLKKLLQIKSTAN